MSTQPKTVLTAYNTTTSAAAWYGRLFPSLSFYCGILPLVFKAMFIAQKGKLDAACLASLSFEAVTYLERSGVRLHIDGLEQMIDLNLIDIVACFCIDRNKIVQLKFRHVREIGRIIFHYMLLTCYESH